VVLSQVQTNNDAQWVKTRQTGVSTSGFSIALEEDEVQTAPHGQETIGWLAITAGSGTWSGHTYVAAQTARVINGNWIPTSFSGVSFTAAPRFVASLATTNNGDSAHVRYQALTASGVQVTAEEDTTQDGETGHTPEEVAYLAIEGDGTLTVSTGSSVEVTKYYYLGGQRVAMRNCIGATCADPVYLHGDHLGSASLSTNASGTITDEMRYHPYGAWRRGSMPTDRRYTGQREDTYTQLYHMGARWYDAELARWTSPDSIVPEAQNPQSLNRYSYVEGNPLRYSDPTGHCIFGVDTIVCLAVGGMAAGAAIGYGKQVVRNSRAGMSFGDALTTDIDPDPIVKDAFLAGIAVTGGALVATGLGVGAVASTGPTAACADGDCGNEFRTVMEVADRLAEELPALETPYAEAFTGPVQQVTLKAGSVVPRVGDVGGHWFGVQVSQSAAHAEELYNLGAFNDVDAVHMTRFTQDVTGYLGQVAGGTGNQFFIPYSVEIREVMEIIATRPLE
jgi:RHS repeat-associated protein